MISTREISLSDQSQTDFDSVPMTRYSRLSEFPNMTWPSYSALSCQRSFLGTKCSIIWRSIAAPCSGPPARESILSPGRLGLRLALYDLIVNRFPMYSLIHKFREQRFLSHPISTWARLYKLFPHQKTC